MQERVSRCEWDTPAEKQWIEEHIMKKILKEVYCKNCDITLEVAEDVCFCPECAYPLVETGKKIETVRKNKK